MEFRTTQMSYNFGQDGVTDSINITITGQEDSNYITGSFKILKEDLVSQEAETLDELTRKEAFNICKKKFATYLA